MYGAYTSLQRVSSRVCRIISVQFNQQTSLSRVNTKIIVHECIITAYTICKIIVFFSEAWNFDNEFYSDLNWCERVRQEIALCEIEIFSYSHWEWSGRDLQTLTLQLSETLYLVWTFPRPWQKKIMYWYLLVITSPILSKTNL